MYSWVNLLWWVYMIGRPDICWRVALTANLIGPLTMEHEVLFMVQCTLGGFWLQITGKNNKRCPWPNGDPDCKFCRKFFATITTDDDGDVDSPVSPEAVTRPKTIYEFLSLGENKDRIAPY